MATVYKRTERKPIPPGATITTTAKAIPAGATVADGIAHWSDRDGCQRTAIVDGKRLRASRADWTDSKGTKSAPVDHTGECILVVTENYYADYTVGRRRVRKSTKVSDKAVAQRIANQWENDEHLESEGIVDDEEALLAKYRLMPISDHIAAFIAFRATSGGTENHRERTRKHIEEFVEAGKWETVRSIHVDDVTRHVERMRGNGAASRTIQARLQSIKSFTKWLTEDHRIKRNPLAKVRKPDPEEDRRHERRMLLREEWFHLVAAIENSNVTRNGMTAAERLLLYRTAVQTGLRAGELHALTPGRLNLTENPPYIACKAAGTKNRKPAKQYIDPQLAADLAQHVARRSGKAPVFGIAAVDELSRTIEADLADARGQWLESIDDDEARQKAEESEFLARTNHDGEHLVFHSLRHTCGAWMAMDGVSVKVVQQVMRHSTPVLTLNTYGHLLPGQCEGAAVRIAALMTPDQTSANLSHTSPIQEAG